MRFALLLLWLTILDPGGPRRRLADVAPRRRGDPHLGAVHRLSPRSCVRPMAGMHGPQQDQALIITYRARHRSRGAGGGHPRPVAGAGHSAAGTAQRSLATACCRGSGRTSRRAASWRSWSAAARGSSGTAPAPRRPPLPRSARASRRRSAPAFSPSGSIRAPLIPNCVSS